MFCPNCGKHILKGTHFCPYCGQKLNTIHITRETKQNLYHDKHPNYYRTNFSHEHNPKRISEKAKIMFACLIGVVLVGGVYHHIHQSTFKSINLHQQLKGNEYTAPTLARALNKPATKVNFSNKDIEPNIGTKNSDGSVSPDSDSYYVRGHNLVIYDPSWKFEKVRLKLISANNGKLTFKCTNKGPYSDVSDTLSDGSVTNYDKLKGHTFTFTNKQKAHFQN